MTYEDMREIDSKNMFEILKNFPEQVKEAIEIGKKAPLMNAPEKPKNFLILGMGGSAIGGDLLRSYCAATKGADRLRIAVNRSYDIPGWVDEETCVIASSYSGGTEETLSAFEQAFRITKNIICITTGGKLGEQAKEKGVPIIEIPGGMQPRCALGYSFFPMLIQLMRLGAFEQIAVEETEAAFEELIPMLESDSMEFADMDAEDYENANVAIQLADDLIDAIPIIVSASERTDVVNLRWRGQFQENAKNIAFGAYLPEMNHNEINGYANPLDGEEYFFFIFLTDPEDHPRVQIRFDVTQELLEDICVDGISLSGEGDYLLTRMFSLIYLGDWTSYYLALYNSEDPTPIPQISVLKKALSLKK